MILAIDTSTGTSVAVVDRAGLGVVRTSSDTRGHAERIGTFIAEVLAESGVRPSELDAVAVGMGPGPFTGLRVGIAAARTFALGAGVPILTVVSHDAVAFGEQDPVLVVTDARRRELAYSTYAVPGADSLPVRTSGPSLTLSTEIESAVTGYDGYRRIDAATVDAASLGRLALARFDAGAPAGPREPVYLRAPDVTLAAPKRVSR